MIGKIILTIVLFLVLLLLIPAKFSVGYTQSGIRVDFNWLFLQLRLFPKSKPNKAVSSKKIDKSANSKNNNKERRSFFETLEVVSALLQGVGPFLRFVLHHISWSSSFDCSYSSVNAAKTAIGVGEVNALLYAFYSVLQNTFSVHQFDTKVSPDYNKDESTNIKCTVLLKTAPLWLILGGFRFLRVSGCAFLKNI